MTDGQLKLQPEPVFRLGKQGDADSFSRMARSSSGPTRSAGPEAAAQVFLIKITGPPESELAPRVHVAVDRATIDRDPKVRPQRATDGARGPNSGRSQTRRSRPNPRRSDSARCATWPPQFRADGQFLGSAAGGAAVAADAGHAGTAGRRPRPTTAPSSPSSSEPTPRRFLFIEAPARGLRGNTRCSMTVGAMAELRRPDWSRAFVPRMIHQGLLDRGKAVMGGTRPACPAS